MKCRKDWFVHITVTSLNWTSSVVALVVPLVVISSGASLSVWKDAERKAALWERGRGRREEEMKFDWQGVREWVTHPAPWMWSYGPILGCGDTCMCVCMWLRARTHARECALGSIQHLKSPNFMCVCASTCVRSCVCWRKMKVVWWPNHNTEARFKRRYLSSLPPALKSPPLHHHPVNHSLLHSGVYQLLTTSLISCVCVAYCRLTVRITAWYQWSLCMDRWIQVMSVRLCFLIIYSDASTGQFIRLGHLVPIEKRHWD